MSFELNCGTLCVIYLFMLIVHGFIYECICEDLALLRCIVYIL